MEKANAALRQDYNNFQEQSRQALHEAQDSQQRMSEHYERVSLYYLVLLEEIVCYRSLFVSI